MYARWSTFAVGLGLVLAPLLLGYQEVGAILLDVTVGVLACVLSLAARELPGLRFLALLPAAWLLWSGHAASDASALQAEVAGGALLAVAALVPRARVTPRLPATERRAGVRV
jgi:hypothetical protein